VTSARGQERHAPPDHRRATATTASLAPSQRLETERLGITAPCVEHAVELRDAIAETFDDLRRWMEWATHVPTIEETRENLQRASRLFETGRDFRYHLFRKEDGRLVGCSGLHNVNSIVPSVEIGYWVRACYGRRGYITEAVDALTRHAMDDLRVNRVQIHMSSKNERSALVPRRLGFELEGVLRNHARHPDGSLRDTMIFAKTR